MRTKGRVYQAVVRSVLLYGCETWPVRVAGERVLEVFDNDSIRRILRVRYRDSVPSVELRHRLSYTGTARAKKAPLAWSCCKTSRSRAFFFPHRLARGADELEAS